MDTRTVYSIIDTTVNKNPPGCYQQPSGPHIRAGKRLNAALVKERPILRMPAPTGEWVHARPLN